MWAETVGNLTHRRSTSAPLHRRLPARFLAVGQAPDSHPPPATGSGNDAPRPLPGVTDLRIRAGVDCAARLAADVLRRRRELSHRVAIMRSGPVIDLPDPAPDTRLTPALLPQLRSFEAQSPQPQPALLTSVAADGRHLRGEIEDEVRVLALTGAPSEWAVLTGRIDAVAWRAATAATPDKERTRPNCGHPAV